MELLTIQLKKMFLENINNIFNGNFEDKIIIENSTKKEFGDFQTNFAMITSKILEKILEKLQIQSLKILEKMI